MKPGIRAIAATPLLAAAFFCSCIKESWEGCPPGQGDEPVEVYPPRVVVKLEAEAEGLTPLPDYDIETVRVYVFDEDGLCTDVWNGGRYTAGEEYAVPLDLPEGDCTLVAWTNLHEEVFGVSHPLAQPLGQRIDEINLFRNMPSGERVTFDVPDLLHGDVGAEVVYRPEPETITIPIRPVTYRVTYLVTGLPETADEYRFTVGDREFRLGFDGALTHNARPAEFFYERTARFTDGGEQGAVLTATMSMVGLSDDARRFPPTFAFTDAATDTQYYTADLIDMIIRTYQAQHNGASPDFGREFEFLVPLRFKMGIGIELNSRPWYYVEDEWVME